MHIICFDNTGITKEISCTIYLIYNNILYINIYKIIGDYYFLFFYETVTSYPDMLGKSIPMAHLWVQAGQANVPCTSMLHLVDRKTRPHRFHILP